MRRKQRALGVQELCDLDLDVHERPEVPSRHARKLSAALLALALALLDGAMFCLDARAELLVVVVVVSGVVCGGGAIAVSSRRGRIAIRRHREQQEQQTHEREDERTHDRVSRQV